MRASTVASGPASSETQVFSSRCRSGTGLTSNAGARHAIAAIDMQKTMIDQVIINVGDQDRKGNAAP